MTIVATILILSLSIFSQEFGKTRPVSIPFNINDGRPSLRKWENDAKERSKPTFNLLTFGGQEKFILGPFYCHVASLFPIGSRPI